MLIQMIKLTANYR